MQRPAIRRHQRKPSRQAHARLLSDPGAGTLVAHARAPSGASSTTRSEPARGSAEFDKVEPLREPYTARAVFVFAGRQEDGELPLAIGDLVHVQAAVGTEWLRGRLDGSGEEGHFPACFIEITKGTPTKTKAPVKSAQNPPRVPPQGLEGPSGTRPRWCLVRFSFETSEEGDLSPLIPGDQVEVLREVDGNWFFGAAAGKTGIFPRSYVQVLDPAGPPQAVAVAAFGGTLPGQLRLIRGQVVELTGRLDKDWLRGRIGEAEGILPASHVRFGAASAAALERLAAAASRANRPAISAEKAWGESKRSLSISSGIVPRPKLAGATAPQLPATGCGCTIL